MFENGLAVKVDEVSREIRRQAEQEAEVQYAAMHDALTGLPNRGLFLDRLRLTLSRLQRRPERHFAVMFLDIDQFESINERLGRAAGDALLLEITKRLHECLRPQDTVSRFGGDEFAMLLDEVDRREDMELIVERVQATTRRPMVLDGQAIEVSSSVGVVMVTPEYQRAEDVVRAAEMAVSMEKLNSHT